MVIKPVKKALKNEHIPTKPLCDTVRLHAMVGTPQEVIADILDIDAKTLRKHYRKELDQSLAIANSVIGGSLFNKAKGGDTAAQIFWLKTRAGFREKEREEGLGDAQPMTINFTVAEAVKDIKVTNADT